jgi:hypothetical protein
MGKSKPWLCLGDFYTGARCRNHTKKKGAKATVPSGGCRTCKEQRITPHKEILLGVKQVYTSF